MFDAPDIPEIDLDKILPELSSTIEAFDPDRFSEDWTQHLGAPLARPRSISRLLAKQVASLDEASSMAVLFDFLFRHYPAEIGGIIPAVLEAPGAKDGYSALTRSLTASSPELDDELADMDQPIAAIMLRVLICALFELDPKSTSDAFLADGAARAYSHRFDQGPDIVLQTLSEAYARQMEETMPEDCHAYLYVLSGIRGPREFFLEEPGEAHMAAAVSLVKQHMRKQRRHAISCPNCQPIDEAEAIDDCIAMLLRSLLTEEDEDGAEEQSQLLAAMLEVYCDGDAYIASLVSNEGEGAAMATLRYEILDCDSLSDARRVARGHPVAIRHATLAKTFSEIVESFEERMSHPEKLWED